MCLPAIDKIFLLVEKTKTKAKTKQIKRKKKATKTDLGNGKSNAR